MLIFIAAVIVFVVVVVVIVVVVIVVVKVVIVEALQNMSRNGIFLEVDVPNVIPNYVPPSRLALRLVAMRQKQENRSISLG